MLKFAANLAFVFAPKCFGRKGLTFWSLGSFLQRGRGLPAGPLGLLGLSEGLSYLAAGRPKSAESARFASEVKQPFALLEMSTIQD